MAHFKRIGESYPSFLDKTILNLTAAGKVTLAQYPDEALRHAFSELKRAGKKDDPVLWLHKVCRSWCKDHHTWPDSAWVDERYVKYEWDVSSPLLDAVQPYSLDHTTRPESNQRSKDTHIRTLDQDEIEGKKRDYRDIMRTIAYAKNDLELDDTERNRSWLKAHQRRAQELKELLMYNNIDYTPTIPKMDTSKEQAMINLAKARHSPGYQKLLSLYGEEVIYNMERQILERAEANENKRKGMVFAE